MKLLLTMALVLTTSISIFAKGAGDTAIVHPNPVPSPETTRITLPPQVIVLSGTNGTDTARQLTVDQDALDSARMDPRKYLFGEYIFQKKPQPLNWFFLALAAVILFVMWKWVLQYSIYNGLCKDPSYDANGNLRPVKDSPYSYSRVQLLWWSMIILTCYVFFFGTTGVLLPLNATSVLLLGFGAIVCGLGKIIDNRQILAARGFRAQDNTDDGKPEFVKDILSDENGVSVHRFQAAIFNLVFGIGFLGFFVKSMILADSYPFPDFTEWQFSLLGISSATYLGLKSAENNPGAMTRSQQPASQNTNPN